jgi:hypothetical protein
VESAATSLPQVAELLTALLAAVALVGVARGSYRRTLGRRRDRYLRLRRLGTRTQLSFFTSVIGEPPAIRRTREVMVTNSYNEEYRACREPKDFTEAVYVDSDFYLHVLADEDETVHAFSVTSRRKAFRPIFRPP